MTAEEAGELLERILREARSALGSHDAVSTLEGAYRLSRAELAGGRRLDAALDLIREAEKILAQSLGAEAGRAFMTRVGQHLATQ
jgi:hypothetical protein